MVSISTPSETSLHQQNLKPKRMQSDKMPAERNVMFLYKLQQFSLLVVLVLVPTTSSASGGDVLSFLWLQALLLLVVILSLITTKISRRNKAIVFSIYVVVDMICIMATENLPYSQNIILINSICTIVPAIFWGIPYLLLWNKPKHNNGMQSDAAKPRR